MFRKLMGDVYTHLTQKESRTAEHFQTVIKRIRDAKPSWRHLEVQAAEYFTQYFPSVQLESWEADLKDNCLMWGLVIPGNNQIHLNESLVHQFEQETDDVCIPSPFATEYISLPRLSIEAMVVVFDTSGGHLA
jgi:hypothetical protein